MAVPMMNPYVMPVSPTAYTPTAMTPYYQNPYTIQPLQNQQQNTNGVIMSWVQGINGAKAYPLAPNSRAFLFDSEKDVFYVKNTDQSGMPQPIREFEYVEVTPETTDSVAREIDTSKFATKEDLKEILSKLDDLKESRNDRRNNNGKSSIRGTSEPRNSGPIQ